MIMNKRPSFIKDDELSSIIDNDEAPIEDEFPEYATFDEWQDLGYNVMKGERSCKKQNGVAVFHRDQVVEDRYSNCREELDFTDHY